MKERKKEGEREREKDIKGYARDRGKWRKKIMTLNGMW